MSEIISKEEKNIALESIISSAVQIPGVKVNRKKFLAEIFATEEVNIQNILENGPIEEKVSQTKLNEISKKLILKRTSQSSAASFLAGMPGGIAMAATIPADVMQFFGMALKLAQELSYLYGAEDLWIDGKIDDEKVKNQLILYCGVMFGVSGAVSGVRVLTTQVAKVALKKIPQKALTKTFWYPILKQIGKALSIKITKSTVAKGVSKAIPIIGGVISGGLNFASMLPMANRLQDTLDSAVFNYNEDSFENDLNIIENIIDGEEIAKPETKDMKTKLFEGGKKTLNNISGMFNKNDKEDVYEALQKLANLKEKGVISQEEFDNKKAELLAKI